MEQIFRKTGNSIFSFKKGDIIIRLEPTYREVELYSENLGITVVGQSSKDNSFRQVPVEFVAIENNMLYVKGMKVDYQNKKIVYKLPIEDYSENWALFVVPDGLTLEDCI